MHSPEDQSRKGRRIAEALEAPQASNPAPLTDEKLGIFAREYAADMIDFLGCIRKQRRIEREAWIEKARLEFAPSDREDCAVCGKFRQIAQAHHVVPLAHQYARGYVNPSHDHIWLCPNHHTFVHALIEGHHGSRDMEKVFVLLRGSTAGEVRAMSKVALMAWGKE